MGDLTASGSCVALPVTFPMTSLVLVAWARPGTEDLEGQRATHRPNTQESSLIGVDNDYLGVQFIA